MHAPQLIYLIVIIMGLTYTLIKDGQEKRDKNGRVERYNFGGTLLVALGILGVLYWGGFFG